jgi:hypothetical protein
MVRVTAEFAKLSAQRAMQATGYSVGWLREMQNVIQSKGAAKTVPLF